jgi:asparagine synthase (glutamine-hydrolysing)
MLESGHYLVFNKNSFSKKDYSKKNTATITQSVNRKDTINIVKNSFEKSVKYHLESDVPTGVFLSGGIDSTSVLSVASKFTKVNTLTIGFEEQKWDESKVSKKISQYYNTNHHEYIVKEQEAIDSLDDFINTLDQPTVDGFNTYFISKFSKESGFKVVLSGLGGDELFGGYPSFKRMKIINQYLKIKNNFSLDGLINEVIPKKFLKKYNSRIIDIVNSRNLLDSYIALRGIFSKEESLKIGSHVLNNNFNGFSKNNLSFQNNNGINSKSRQLELNNYLKNQLLRDSDVFGMKWSTEIRTPFIDKDFINSIQSLPDKYIFENKKAILTEGLNLPMHIINQKKQGFTFPFELWLKQSLGKEIENETHNIIGSNSEWYKFWTIFVLKKWISKNI